MTSGGHSAGRRVRAGRGMGQGVLCRARKGHATPPRSCHGLSGACWEGAALGRLPFLPFPFRAWGGRHASLNRLFFLAHRGTGARRGQAALLCRRKAIAGCARRPVSPRALPTRGSLALSGLPRALSPAAPPRLPITRASRWQEKVGASRRQEVGWRGGGSQRRRGARLPRDRPPRIEGLTGAHARLREGHQGCRKGAAAQGPQEEARPAPGPPAQTRGPLAAAASAACRRLPADLRAPLDAARRGG